MFKLNYENKFLKPVECTAFKCCFQKTVFKKLSSFWIRLVKQLIAGVCLRINKTGLKQVSRLGCGLFHSSREQEKCFIQRIKGYINSWLSRCCTARGSIIQVLLGGPSRVRSYKFCFIYHSSNVAQSKEQQVDFHDETKRLLVKYEKYGTLSINDWYLILKSCNFFFFFCNENLRTIICFNDGGRLAPKVFMELHITVTKTDGYVSIVSCSKKSLSKVMTTFEQT